MLPQLPLSLVSSYVGSGIASDSCRHNGEQVFNPLLPFPNTLDKSPVDATMTGQNTSLVAGKMLPMLLQ